MKSGCLILKSVIVLGIFSSFFCLASISRQRAAIPGEELIPVELKCEYKVNPLGIDVQKPRLSWILQSSERCQKQTGFQVLVADSLETLEKNQGNLWDSGKVGSKETLQIVYEGLPLRSGLRCYWKVKVWDKDGKATSWSKPAIWEMALLSQKDWSGQWIEDGRPAPERDEDFYKDDPAPLFRKEFRVSKEIRRARLYITGLGYYEARINGRRAGDQILDPGWTNYKKRVFYSVYDVTGFLQKGPNCIGVILGNGWYNPLPLRMWGDRNIRDILPVGRPRVIAQLNIELTDGSIQSIATDTSWKFHAGPIIRNNIYLGEVYDARKEIKGWDIPGLDDRPWDQAVIASEPLGALRAQPQPPVKITAALKPVRTTEPIPGVYIYDFGQNFAGWVRMKLEAPAGTEVKLRYGELLYKDGSLNPMTSVCGQIKGKEDGKNIGGPGSPEIAYQGDIYIAKGEGEEVYTPRFTFHGFRYVEIIGYPGKPALDAIEGLRLNSAVGETGSFACSNGMFNRIQEMTRWTFLSNIFSVQSGDPHRERFAYGGDIAATSEAFLFNFDMANFYAKSVADWQDAALPDGMLTDTAPFVGIQYCGVAWAMVHPLLLYQLYQYYGNSQLIEEQYETARRWLDLAASQNTNHLIKDGLSDHEGLEPAPSTQMVTPLYYRSAQLVSLLAGILGRKDEAEKYSTLAEEIKKAYIQNFLKPGSGKFDPETQASQAFALFLGLVPKNEKAAAIDFLLNRILATCGGHLSTGIFGTKFLLNVLSESGQADVASAIVNQKSFPGWGYMLENGATTLWEHWEGSDNTFSHNHPMFGSVSEWFYKWLAGIQPHPEAVGFDRIIIRPQPVADLKWVKARVYTVRGEIRSEWCIENGEFRLNLAIPANTVATVYIPVKNSSFVKESGRPAEKSEGVRFLRMEDDIALYEVGSGTYSFSSLC